MPDETGISHSFHEAIIMVRSLETSESRKTLAARPTTMREYPRRQTPSGAFVRLPRPPLTFCRYRHVVRAHRGGERRLSHRRIAPNHIADRRVLGALSMSPRSPPADHGRRDLGALGR